MFFRGLFIAGSIVHGKDSVWNLKTVKYQLCLRSGGGCVVVLCEQTHPMFFLDCLLLVAPFMVRTVCEVWKLSSTSCVWDWGGGGGGGWSLLCCVSKHMQCFPVDFFITGLKTHELVVFQRDEVCVCVCCFARWANTFDDFSMDCNLYIAGGTLPDKSSVSSLKTERDHMYFRGCDNVCGCCCAWWAATCNVSPWIVYCWWHSYVLSIVWSLTIVRCQLYFWFSQGGDGWWWWWWCVCVCVCVCVVVVVLGE